MIDYIEFKKEQDKKTTKRKSKKVKKIKSKSKSNAKKVAQKVLKESLKQEYSIELTVNGDTHYCAGAIIELDESFGKFQGRYIIDRVVHQIDGDYSCQITAFNLTGKRECRKKSKREDKKEL